MQDGMKHAGGYDPLRDLAGWLFPRRRRARHVRVTFDVAMREFLSHGQIPGLPLSGRLR